MSTNMKNLIAETFFTMVQQKGIDKITVKDLVETCHISRQTFYYHFQDILDVIQWSAQQAIQVALKHSLEEEDPERAIRAFVTAAVENRSMIQKLLQSQKHEYIERIIVDCLKVYLAEMLRVREPDLDQTEKGIQVAVQFCAFGIAGVLLENCSQPDCDPAQLAHQLLLVLQGKYPSNNMQKETGA